MKTETKYGTKPVVIGNYDFDPVEMMFWLYCPVKMPKTEIVFPPNLNWTRPIFDKCISDFGEENVKYAYVTAKTLWVSPENPGNRPGWHSDGFLTDDINYIWCDRVPTEFLYDGSLHSFDAHHTKSLQQMERLCCSSHSSIFTLSEKTIIKLDECVLHRTQTSFTSGLRSFVKISFSDHPYALAGNSVNHELGSFTVIADRSPERNCPIFCAPAQEGE